MMKSVLCLLAVAAPLVQGRFNVRVDKEVQVKFSESAGVRDIVAQHLKDKIAEDGFELTVMQFGENGAKSNREKFDLPDTVLEGRRSGSFVKTVEEHFQKKAPPPLHRDKKTVEPHAQKMKVNNKPWYMALEGCGPKIQVSVHGISSTTFNNEEGPISVCLYDLLGNIYELGGNKIGCEDVLIDDDDDDLGIASFTDFDLVMDTTIFAKIKGILPAPEGGTKGTLKAATVTAEYKVSCVR